jgi:hypothetical protein
VATAGTWSDCWATSRGRAVADPTAGELWTEREYEVLFGRFPPTGTRPTDDRIALLAAELGRTFDAVSWQWDDGASYCTGGPAATASEPLKAWLDRTFPGYPHA